MPKRVPTKLAAHTTAADLLFIGTPRFSVMIQLQHCLDICTKIATSTLGNLDLLLQAIWEAATKNLASFQNTAGWANHKALRWGLKTQENQSSLNNMRTVKIGQKVLVLHTSF